LLIILDCFLNYVVAGNWLRLLANKAVFIDASNGLRGASVWLKLILSLAFKVCKLFLRE
jgi:hypothetical protein